MLLNGGLLLVGSKKYVENRKIGNRKIGRLEGIKKRLRDEETKGLKNKVGSKKYVENRK